MERGGRRRGGINPPSTSFFVRRKAGFYTRRQSAARLLHRGSPHDVDKHETVISSRPRHLQLPDPRPARLNTAVDQRPVNRPWTGPGIRRPRHVYCKTKCGFYGFVRHRYVIGDKMDKHGCTSGSGNLRQVNTAVDHLLDVRNPSVTG